MWTQLTFAPLYLLPAILAMLWIRLKLAAKRKIRKHPFNDLVRRPAGEALRLKLLHLNERFNDKIVWMLLVPALIGLAMAIQKSPNWIVPLIYWIIAAIWTICFSVQIHALIKEMDRCELGYDGERFVGEELSRLIALGFEVYHDVPFDNYNIDHVLVGTKGVFSIETKTRSKTLNDDGEKQFRVQFDGQYLQWPNWQDSQSVDQAKNNAKSLSVWLGCATGEKVWVNPILTIPGWMIELKAPPTGLRVLNPKQIYNVCADFPETLSPDQVRRICHQLDQKCRLAVEWKMV